MKRQALILIAAVSLLQTASAQERNFFPKLTFVRSYDVKNINKALNHSDHVQTERFRFDQLPLQHQLPPRPDFMNLQTQLLIEVRYMKMQNRREDLQGIFQGVMHGVMYKNRAGF